MLEWKPGTTNVVVDALSRKAELAAMSQAKGELMAKIIEGMNHDPVARQLVEMAKEGKTKRFWFEDGLLYTIGRRVFILKWETLRREFIKECHDSK